MHGGNTAMTSFFRIFQEFQAWEPYKYCFLWNFKLFKLLAKNTTRDAFLNSPMCYCNIANHYIHNFRNCHKNINNKCQKKEMSNFYNGSLPVDFVYLL